MAIGSPARPFAQLWPPLKHDTVTPSGLDWVTDSQSIGPGQHVVIETAIPHNRLYGVLVELQGATGGDTIRVNLWGSEDPDGNLSELQYTGLAKADNNWRDPFQQWRYRDSLDTRTLRLELVNEGQTTAYVAAHIQAEPF